MILYKGRDTYIRINDNDNLHISYLMDNGNHLSPRGSICMSDGYIEPVIYVSDGKRGVTTSERMKCGYIERWKISLGSIDLILNHVDADGNRLLFNYSLYTDK